MNLTQLAFTRFQRRSLRLQQTAVQRLLLWAVGRVIFNVSNVGFFNLRTL